MDLETRLRVTTDLCCDCVRNAAYYKSGWTSTNELKKGGSDFWVNLNGNFLDIAALCWCYLFGDPKAEFKWQRLIETQTEFSSRLYGFLNCSENDFDEYISSMRTYRDKFVAHRDRYLSSDPKVHYPDLDLAVKSASFLFSELVNLYPQMKEINIHKDLHSFYKSRLKLGRKEYEKVLDNLV